MIDIQNLSFSYKEEKILENITMHFSKGKFSVILGRNGSGKSTLFKIMTGLEKKYTGSLFINKEERRLMQVGKANGVRLGFLPQFHQVTFPFSVMDVVLTGRASFFRFAPSLEDKKIVEETLKRFHLWHYKDKAYTSLSGGERQLVLLCRVLVQRPGILLLDEPTNHLDLYYQVAVLDCIRTLADEGCTVLCIMHDPNLAFMYGDELFVMRNKELVALQGLNKQETHRLLEETYDLSLSVTENQGLQIFTPNRKGNGR